LQFSEIIGHQELKNTLVQAVAHNHVAHAQLFVGPDGCANLALALAFAAYLNCEDRQSNDSCGRCASCIKTSKLAHPDVHHIFPVASTKKIKENIADAFMPLWREFVAENPYKALPDWLEFIGADNKQGNISANEARNVIAKISLKAYEAEYKILLLWQPEMLNVYSANALLKVLEEPPPKTIFLLVCNDSNQLLSTIISRTQRVNIPAFTDDEIIEFLTERKNLSATDAQRAAYLAEGDLNKAISLAFNDKDNKHAWFADWMRKAYKPELAALVALADEFDGKSKEFQKGMFDYGLVLFRDLFLFQNGSEQLVRLLGEELTFVQNFSKAVKPHVIEKVVNELSDAHYHLERNARAKIVFLDLSLTIARLFKAN
jgi:DNA polymerase III subunit delta'